MLYEDTTRWEEGSSASSNWRRDAQTESDLGEQNQVFACEARGCGLGRLLRVDLWGFESRHSLLADILRKTGFGGGVWGDEGADPDDILDFRVPFPGAKKRRAALQWGAALQRRREVLQFLS